MAQFAVHKFDTTGEAYDACQMSMDVNKGDILIIEDEKVVGIADVWPVAVTLANGELHTPGTNFTWCSHDDTPYEHAQLAFDIADAFGWETTLIKVPK